MFALQKEHSGLHNITCTVLGDSGLRCWFCNLSLLTGLKDGFKVGAGGAGAGDFVGLPSNIWWCC
jgi:hypothetical protein